ncbi:hypothetical protein NHX12_023912, partial [Muraenolepis orangiensis]
ARTSDSLYWLLEEPLVHEARTSDSLYWLLEEPLVHEARTSDSLYWLLEEPLVHEARTSDSLYWLLEEPLVHEARMDICSSNTPGLMPALCGTRTPSGEEVPGAVGPEADGGGAWDAEGLW